MPSSSTKLKDKLLKLPPVVAVFDWEGCQDRIEIVGPLQFKMAADEGVIFQINDNRRGIAEKLGIDPWEIEGLAAVYGRLMLNTPELVRIAPIVYETSKADRHDTIMDYRDGVAVEISGQQVASGAVKVAELEHINWLESISRPTEPGLSTYLVD